MGTSSLITATVPERLHAVQERIARAARRAGREADSVTLVGISKRKPPELMSEAVRAGLEHLGENYVQEAAHKLPHLLAALARHGVSQPCLHFVGRLQRNKAREAVRLFDVVESVDRLPLAEELARRVDAEDRDLPVLLQVDLAGERQKGGAAPRDLPALIEGCARLRRLRVVGLMTLPPAVQDPEDSRPLFAELRELRNALRDAPGAGQLQELSMGMSADFEVAIEEGATMVRVGSAIFGPREDWVVSR